MTVALFTHEACFDHDTGPWHPESAERLRRVMAALEDEAFATLVRELAPLATEQQLCLVHEPAYVARILKLKPPAGAHVPLDGGDTLVSPGSVEAALRGVGGAVAAVDAVMEGWARAAFVATRPPGHHAERAQAMGFCLFASAAIAARHAMDEWGLERVAVVDFDVHHGNGTQQAAWSVPGFFYASSHQMPCFPGTGPASERGEANNVLNVPLAPGSGSSGFRTAWAEEILPAVAEFAPQLLIVSAGFDAHKADPLAQIALETRDFGWLTAALCDLAGRYCNGRLVSILEGGYDLDALSVSAALHVRELLRN